MILALGVMHMDQGIMTLITVGVVLGLAAFVLWLLYTVIWHGVRRGMQEFAYARLSAAQAMDAAPRVAAPRRRRRRWRTTTITTCYGGSRRKSCPTTCRATGSDRLNRLERREGLVEHADRVGEQRVGDRQARQEAQHVAVGARGEHEHALLRGVGRDLAGNGAQRRLRLPGR